MDYLNYRCPRWEDLPPGLMFNRELAEFVNDKFQGLVSADSPVTNTMVQNYVKWDMMPKPVGRKYSKEHLAYLIVITLLKEILSIKNVKKGIDLVLNHMSPEMAYNVFAVSFEKALHAVVSVTEDEDGLFRPRTIGTTKATVAIDAAAYALAFKIITKDILDNEGDVHFLKVFE